MHNCNPIRTPSKAYFKFSEGNNHPPTYATLFRSIISSLRYLIHTRPDLTFSVGYLNRYMESLTSEHMAALKRILQYIKGTASLGLSYMKEESFTITGYSDSDHAGDPIDHKSTTRVPFFVGTNPIS